MKMKNMKVIISGGGTGGHIFPALSIAQAIKCKVEDADILFVGAEGKMEMEKVPAAGFPIKGLPVAGLQRKLTLKNLELPFKVLKSVTMASKIIRDFKPDVAVGVGGYASAPMLWSAQCHGVPTLIQEQNSYAGLTNRILGRKAECICTAYEGMGKFFPEERIILTGNPIRKEIDRPTPQQKMEGYEHFSLDPSRKTIFVVGGSLGSRTLNEAMKKWVIGEGDRSECQIIWQSGRYYKSGIDSFLAEHPSTNVRNYDFIKRMDLAFAVADVIVSRAGAGTISELCAEGKATIFVPSPNVTEDHQTHNALALVEKEAALMVKDCEAVEKLMSVAQELVNNDAKIKKLEENILKLARKDASERIASEVIRLAEGKK